MAMHLRTNASTQKTPEQIKDLKEWALPASIAFAEACVLGAGVLVSMPLRGIEETARRTLQTYLNNYGLKVELSNRFSDSIGTMPLEVEVELKGGEFVGQYAK